MPTQVYESASRVKNDESVLNYYNKFNGLSVGSGVYQQGVTPNFNGNFHLGMGINAPMLDVATPCTFTPAVICKNTDPFRSNLRYRF